MVKLTAREKILSEYRCPNKIKMKNTLFSCPLEIDLRIQCYTKMPKHWLLSHKGRLVQHFYSKQENSFSVRLVSKVVQQRFSTFLKLIMKIWTTISIFNINVLYTVVMFCFFSKKHFIYLYYILCTYMTLKYKFIIQSLSILKWTMTDKLFGCVFVVVFVVVDVVVVDVVALSCECSFFAPSQFIRTYPLA